MRLPEILQPTVDQQQGLLTRRQLAAAGVGPEVVRWALGRTARAVLPGVVSVFTGDLSPAQRLIAASLWAGAGAQLAGSSAVRWHQIGDVPDDGVVRLLVGWGTSSRREGWAYRRRTTRLDAHPWHRGPLTVCSRARSLIDTARELRDPDAVRDLLVSAVQRRHVRERDLRAELESGAVGGSAVPRRALRDIAVGAWSLREADVLHELARSRVLPRVWPNPVLTTPDGLVLPSPDAWIDEVQLALQLHSRTYHLRDRDWEGTVRGDTVFGEYGIPVLAITPTAFRADPAGYRMQVERAYRSLLSAPRPRVVTMTARGSGCLAG